MLGSAAAAGGARPYASISGSDVPASASSRPLTGLALLSGGHSSSASSYSSGVPAPLLPALPRVSLPSFSAPSLSLSSSFGPPVRGAPTALSVAQRRRRERRDDEDEEDGSDEAYEQSEDGSDDDDDDDDDSARS